MSRTTPLTALHVEAGARTVDFAGWQMPIQYAGIQVEHRRVREAVGVFDVSHMGRVSVSGTGAAAFLDALLPTAVERLAVGRMAYTVMCNQAGGTIDDLAVYRLDAKDFLLVINASRTAVDLAWIVARHTAHAQAGGAPVSIRDLTPEQGMIAVQGPQAEALVATVLAPPLAQLGFFHCTTVSGRTGDWLVSRSGYTGEDGFEVICPALDAPDLWRDLGAAGGQPAGLAARDTLRIEAGLCLYGQELTEEITPVEAGLAWTLRLDKEAGFPGRERLRQQVEKGPPRRRVGLRLWGRGIPRAGQEVRVHGHRIGMVTSGTHSPTLGVGIAMAYVDADADLAGGLEIRGRRGGLPAGVVPLPFVPARVRRRRRGRARR